MRRLYLKCCCSCILVLILVLPVQASSVLDSMGTGLSASLLESAGIRIAVLTTPGHIFMMFDTEVPDFCVSDITFDPSKVVL